MLSRKIDEKIKIGDDIEITIVAISGENVRIGINAPREIKVLRSEVYDDIQAQNKESASLGIPQGLQELFKNDFKK